MHVLSLFEVNERSRTFGIDAWFRQTWNDWRLAYPSTAQGGCFDARQKREGFPLNKISEIWVPDIYIENQIGGAEVSSGAWWIYPDGKVVYVRQMRLQLSCWEMTFESLPFDVQYCSSRIGAFLEDSLGLSLDFYEAGPVGNRGFVTIAGSDKQSAGSLGWTLTHAIGSKPDLAGYGATQAEPMVFIEFELTRNAEYHTAFVIVPALLTVIICYFVFYMDPSRSDRAALSVVCFLVQSGLMGTQLISLPQLGLQVWLLTFLLYGEVFCVYAIFAVVLEDYLARQKALVSYAREKALAASSSSFQKPHADDSVGSASSVLAQEQNSSAAAAQKVEGESTGLDHVVVGFVEARHADAHAGTPSHKRRLPKRNTPATRSWQKEARALTREEVLDAGELGLFNAYINLSSTGNVRLQPKHVEIFSRIVYLVTFVVFLASVFTSVSRPPRDTSTCTDPITLQTTAFTTACT